jgi:hypothetical protein
MEKQTRLHSHGIADGLPNIKRRKRFSMEKWSSLLFNIADHTLPSRNKRKNKFEGRNSLTYFFTALLIVYQILREEKDLKQCNLSFHDSDYTLPNNKKRKKNF